MCETTHPSGQGFDYIQRELDTLRTHNALLLAACEQCEAYMTAFDEEFGAEAPMLAARNAAIAAVEEPKCAACGGAEEIEAGDLLCDPCDDRNNRHNEAAENRS